MNTNKTAWRIPYGIADFIKLRKRNHYHVDKTHFLPQLEEAGEFLFLIRPRRFGKSLLQSVMECYYDANWVKRFDTLFADTWIAEHPTPEKGRYITLRFDFSAVRSDPKLVEDLMRAIVGCSWIICGAFWTKATQPCFSPRMWCRTWKPWSMMYCTPR